MILSNIWKKYEKLVLKYTDLNRQFYSLIGLTITIIPFIIFNYFVYYFFMGFDNKDLHFVMFIIALGKGRLLLFYIMDINNYKAKGENWFSNLLAYLTVGSAVIVGIYYLIIKDINKDFKKAPKVKIETIKYNNNFLNNTNKYDYLKNNNK